jgi:hypothetical protein
MQSPIPQTWTVDYPLLAYKNAEPDDRSITIMHLALDITSLNVDLGK